MALKKKTKLEKPIKKINRRNQAQYPALSPELNLKTRYKELDFDYLDKLSDKDKAWLNNFAEEYVHANLTHKGKKLHKTKRLRKAVYDKNNARNRDLYTRTQAMGHHIRLDDIGPDSLAVNEEDRLITALDLKKSLQNASKLENKTKNRGDKAE